MDIYDTQVLIGTVPSLMVPRTGLLDMFFPSQLVFETEEVAIDIEKGQRRVAPFVSPLVPGKMVEGRGIRTSTIAPAYVKPKTRLDPSKPLKRMVGERVGGGAMSPGQRAQALLVQEMEDHLAMITRRLELMAADALLDGKLTISGEGYPALEIDFSRDTDLTAALTSGDRWGESAVSPYDDIEGWTTTMMEKSGAAPTDVVFTPEAWAYAIADDKIKNAIDTRRGGGSTIELGITPVEGLVYKGTLGTLRLWVYNGWYLNDSNVSTRILPAHTVLLGSAAIDGRRAFGVIKDAQLDYPAMPFAPKSWTENDPGVRWLMTQSAPVMIPFRPDASMCVTVR